MRFERQQHKTHIIDDQKIDVRYDRFTTRFSLSINEQRVYSQLLIPIRIRMCSFSESYQ